MSDEPLQAFERAIRKRDPSVANMLKPGFPESRIRQMLTRAKVKGCVEPIVRLYSWRSATQRKPLITMEETALFPGPPYVLVELELMVAHFQAFEEVSLDHPRYKEVIARY